MAPVLGALLFTPRLAGLDTIGCPAILWGKILTALKSPYLKGAEIKFNEGSANLRWTAGTKAGIGKPNKNPKGKGNFN